MNAFLLQEYVELCREHRETQLKNLQEAYGRFVSTLKSTSLLLIASGDTCPATLTPHLNASPELDKRMEPFLDYWRRNMQKAITE